MVGPKYLPVILALLAFASLAGAVVLAALHNPQAKEAWTAFIAFAAALLGVHIPAPSNGGGGGGGT